MRNVFRVATSGRRPLRTHYIERGSSFTYMKRFFSSVLLALAAATLPLTSYAAALDAPLTCNESGHQFIADLAKQQMIDPKPTRVESNSINAFSPAQGADLTAFGFHVFAVVGYEKDDPMFRVGDGEPVARSAYGVVVFGGESKVQNAIAEAGSTAIVHRVAPLVTAIFCKRS
ncbi:hypothetical protein R69927_00709 [Paraburkholderia domus]|jgi:hypothetical protein|uniref:Uncharacterized protein n=2 Tax=Paraburkholderia domus TaxID=2793075 RepID=A0A9N8QUG1_9BURK|nr:hypothetical protein R70006_01236 [Paraburkholderia domus]CAE6822505.1 hypothetical protein R69927_00709 [Paraburkholderia domus]CAE6834806.1 hypothetical protein R75483_06865 [Paraburkholderia domus]CAE6859601.1 hypothetical protein R70199_00798 [Paraburkholderia domus]CAE6869978.1 hypothetical protein R70211_01139 [Paraburkholderia domus]